MLGKIKPGSIYRPIIIFGSSPQINEVKDVIPALQKKYTNIGINSFPIAYPDVNYWAFMDLETLMHTVNRSTYKGQRLITDYNFKASGLLKQYDNVETFLVDEHTEHFITDNRQLVDDSLVISGCIITLTYLINWCYLKGYTDIYLIGHSLADVWEHFDGADTIEQDADKMCRIRHYVQDAARFVNIYQTDERYDIGLPFKDIEDLL